MIHYFSNIQNAKRYSTYSFCCHKKEIQILYWYVQVLPLLQAKCTKYSLTTNPVYIINWFVKLIMKLHTSLNKNSNVFPRYTTIAAGSLHWCWMLSDKFSRMTTLRNDSSSLDHFKQAATWASHDWTVECERDGLQLTMDFKLLK